MNKIEIDKYVLINFCNNNEYKNKLYEKYDAIEIKEVETKDLIKDTK